MAQIIKITELKLIDTFNQVMMEQGDEYRQLNPNVSVRPVTQKYKCITANQSLAVEYAISQGLPASMVKFGLGILGRESDFGDVFGKFGYKAPAEYMINKMSEISPAIKDMVNWGAKLIFHKDNWVPSMGIAQMTPDIAKKYGVNLEQLMTLSGSLVAATKYLMDLYKITQKYYDINVPSVIIYNKKLINNPSSSGNAALDAAIMSYNLGSTRFTKQYCQTNSTDYLAPCNSPNGVYMPFPQTNPNLKLKVYPNKVVKNYIPNIKTQTGGGNFISSLGYLKEVVGYVRTYGCVR